MSKGQKEPLDFLLALPWWINVVLATLAYVTFAFVLPSQELFSTPISEGLVNGMRKFAPIAAGIFLVPAAISTLLSRHRRKERARRALYSKYEAIQASAKYADSTPVDSACPMCGSELARRSLHNDKATKDGFWECSTYPKCWYRRSA